ncbi:MAG TPA: NYN domain-containing protein [Methanoregula sp.]|nr:NYN domain-containing protein [Methanoregula sp.]
MAMEYLVKPSERQLKLAVLIDADNAQPAVIQGLLDEIAKYGIASVKRIYGDWTSPSMNSWKEKLLTFSIQPIQQFPYTSGKNATDSSLIIDAMDLLHTGKFDGFCLVSSDSDFTRLATRIREAGLVVYGFGEQKTPEPFRRACDLFILTENLRPIREDVTDAKQSEPAQHSIQPKTTHQLKGDTRLVELLRGAVEDAADDSGWANLASVGDTVLKKQSDFDSRSYGYKKFYELIQKTDLFEIQERQKADSPSKIIFVKNKKKQTQIKP